MEIDIKTEAKYLWADPVQMRQVLVNIVTNSSQAIEGKGIIKIACSKQHENFIKIDLYDSGRGIKSEVIQKIFEPLYTTKAMGTGLGLSISKEIVAKHGGTISVISKENEGTTFSILLPADQKLETKMKI